MASIWIIIGLIVSAAAVSLLGASFSVFGLAALFSGAAKSISLMAGALEFSKFVLAAYLHQRWAKLNFLFKSYLTISVVVLSAITSMGIFGFLSDAYSSASAVLEEETIKSQAIKTKKLNIESEIKRLNTSIDEIPANRITRRMQMRAEIEPVVADLIKQSANLDQEIAQSELKIVEVKKRVGPLLYISRAFKTDLDTVVKYLTLILVLVFDPLAICLVIAVSESLNSRKEKATQLETQIPNSAPAENQAASPTPVDPQGSPPPRIVNMRVAPPQEPDQKTG